MRIAIYLRISTDEAHQPYSLDAQEQRLRAYVASQPDWELVRVFTDQMSGATTERPELQRALTEAHARRFDLLLVYRVDRFARSVRGLATLLEQLDAAGVAFRSATEPFDTATPAGRMMVQMLGVFAEFERATIIDRVIAGMERKAARGEWCGGSRPFGYRIDADTGHLARNDDEAPLVPVIFDLYARKRLGAKAIANWLNTRGHRTKTGRPWGHAAVLTVLRNRAYLGEVFFRDAYHPAPHPPLVDTDSFALAQEVLVARGDDHAKRAANGSDYLLSGLIVCTRCDKRYLGTAAVGNRYRYRYYTCYSRNRYGTDTCQADRLPADELDQAVLRALLDVYADSGLLTDTLADAQGRLDAVRSQHQQELALIDAEIRKTEEAIERYLLAFEAGTIPEATCGQRLRTLGAKAAEQRARKTELAAALQDAQADELGPEQLDALHARIRETITRGQPNEQKSLLQALVHEVRVEGRQAIRPVFKIPSSSALPAPGEKVRAMSGSVPPGGAGPVLRGIVRLKSRVELA